MDDSFGLSLRLESFSDDVAVVLSVSNGDTLLTNIAILSQVDKRLNDISKERNDVKFRNILISSLYIL